jgi:hypothetical protein
LDGDTRRHLDKVLNEDDALYAQNCFKQLQSGTTPETEERLIAEVLRYLPEAECLPRETGFRAQVNAAFHVQPTETDEPEATQPTSVFRSMLQAACGKGEQHTSH